MTIPRMLGLLTGLAAIGIAMVAIRVEELRASRRIQMLQVDEDEARRTIQGQEMKLWQLRSPPVVGERSAELKATAEADRPQGAASPEPPKPR